MLPKDTDGVVTNNIRVVFSNTTDFFGRVTIYELDILGRVTSIDAKS